MPGFNIEASRRFGDQWKLNVELRALMDQPAADFLFNQRDDDVLQMEMRYYF